MGRKLGQAERAKGGAGEPDMVGVLDASHGPGYHKKVVNDDIKVSNRERETEILRYYIIYITPKMRAIDREIREPFRIDVCGVAREIFLHAHVFTIYLLLVRLHLAHPRDLAPTAFVGPLTWRY
jgi:hypothetical protein